MTVNQFSMATKTSYIKFFLIKQGLNKFSNSFINYLTRELQFSFGSN